MKRIFKTITFCLLFVAHCGFSVRAQDTSIPIQKSFPSVTEIGKYLVTVGGSLNASNFMAAPYGIYDLSTKKAGAGVALVYNVNQYVGAFTRLDYINAELWRPSGGAQLQYPVNVWKLTVVPFVFTGIAVPFSGAGTANGEVKNISGTGVAVRCTTHLDVIGDWEYWSGSQQIRLGVLWKF